MCGTVKKIWDKTIGAWSSIFDIFEEPEPPPKPIPPPPSPRESDVQIQAELAAEKRRRRRKTGYASTLLSGGDTSLLGD